MADDFSRKRATDWTVQETVWVSYRLVLCLSCIIYQGHICPVLDNAGATQLLGGLLHVWGGVVQDSHCQDEQQVRCGEGLRKTCP